MEALVSALWFAPEERVLATAILFTSNQVGESAEFLLGPVLVGSPAAMPRYLLAFLKLLRQR